MLLLIVLLLTTLTISFMCSLFESAILSVSHSYIAVLIKDGKKSGSILRKLKKNIDRPLAVILTLNTVANTIGAAGIGAQTYHLFGSTWVALSSATLTILILVFSEIIPKKIGAAYWKKIAPFSAYMIRGLIIILYPAVKVLEMISGLIAHDGSHSHVTREEMIVLAEMGEKSGVLLPKEARIIENLLLLSEVPTKDILTPRAVLLAFQEDASTDEIIVKHSPIRFSRIPVYGRDLDDIKGFIFRHELIETHNISKSEHTIKHLVKPLHAVPESKSLADLLDEFINRREHMFLVIDEYGGTAGIVTLEDVIEALLGVEIIDELDYADDMRAYALERWKNRRKGWVL